MTLDPQVYRRAAERLMEKGWIQFSYENPLGTCLMGAIWRANQGLIDITEYISNTEIPCMWQTKECQYIAELLGIEPVNIATWNDNPDRTKDEVIGLLITAAEKLEADGL